jgi:hypothetical protein
MQTVSFQCGHCGKLMGVGAQFLGQQVRCPHCHGVVLAPPAPPSPPAPAPAPPAPDLTATVEHRIAEHEDIFAQPESDDLFGGVPAPRVEMPPAPTPRPAPAPEPARPPEEATVRLPAPEDEPTLNLSSGPEPPVPQPEPTVTWSPPAAAEATVHADAAHAPSPAALTAGPFGDGGDGLPAPLVRRAQQSAKGIPTTTILIVLPLISYGLIITLVAFLLYRDRERWKDLLEGAKKEAEEIREKGHELDKFPDVDGDAPGVKKKRGAVLWHPPDWAYKKPIPPELRTTLGVPLRVGGLEVTPLRAEMKKVGVWSEGQGPNQQVSMMEYPSLVLYLRLRNTSEVAFAPLDPYFDRGWRSDDSKRTPFRPLTLLEAGEKRFYGSSSDWYPRDRPSKDRAWRRAWVNGRVDEPVFLEPGKSLETFVSTDGRTPGLAEALAAADGPVMYRVHMRVGPVEHQGRQVPATAVVGVEIRPDEVKPPPPWWRPRR